MAVGLYTLHTWQKHREFARRLKERTTDHTIYIYIGFVGLLQLIFSPSTHRLQVDETVRVVLWGGRRITNGALYFLRTPLLTWRGEERTAPWDSECPKIRTRLGSGTGTRFLVTFVIYHYVRPSQSGTAAARFLQTYNSVCSVLCG